MADEPKLLSCPDALMPGRMCSRYRAMIRSFMLMSRAYGASTWDHHGGRFLPLTHMHHVGDSPSCLCRDPDMSHATRLVHWYWGGVVLIDGQLLASTGAPCWAKAGL